MNDKMDNFASANDLPLHLRSLERDLAALTLSSPSSQVSEQIAAELNVRHLLFPNALFLIVNSLGGIAACVIATLLTNSSLSQSATPPVSVHTYPQMLAEYDERPRPPFDDDPLAYPDQTTRP